MLTVAGIVLAFAFALGASSFADAQDNERLEAIRADLDDRFIANANRLATEANAAADEAEVAAREARAFPTCVGDVRRTVRTLAGTEERCVNSFLANDQAVERAVNAARSARALARKIRGVFRFRYRHKSPVWYKCSVNNHLRHHGGPCVTTDTVPQTVLFPDLFDKPLFARFNQEQASSDGGASPAEGAERIYGLVKAFAGCLFDKRAPDKTRHSLADLIGQRIFGIACGHPDCNDGDRLADDPIHKLLLDRDPVSGERLASQPTLSRFENAVNRCALYRMADELATRVIERHRRRLDGRARCITIDLDPTDDPTHGRSSTRSSTATTTTGATCRCWPS